MSKSAQLAQERIKRYREGKFGCDIDSTYAIAEAILEELLADRKKTETK